MIAKVEINSFDDLFNLSWSYARGTLARIDKAGLQDELMEHLNEVFDYEPDFIAINDYLWHEFNDDEFIAQHKTLDYVEDIYELKEYVSYKAKQIIWDAVNKNKQDELWQQIQNNYSNCTLYEISNKLEEY